MLAGQAQTVCHVLLWWIRRTMLRSNSGITGETATWGAWPTRPVTATGDVLVKAAPAMKAGAGTHARSARRACSGTTAARSVTAPRRAMAVVTALNLRVNVFVMRRGLVSFASGMLRPFSGSYRTGIPSVRGSTTAVARVIALRMEAVSVIDFFQEIPAACVSKGGSERTAILPALQRRTAHRMGGVLRREVANVRTLLQAIHVANASMA